MNVSLREIWPHALCFAVLSVRLVAEAWPGVLTIWGEQGASAMIAHTNNSSNWCPNQTHCQGRKAVQRLLLNLSSCLGSKWLYWVLMYLLGENGLSQVDQSSQNTAHPSESCQLELLRMEHHASQECSSANVDINHWDTFCNLSFTIKLWGMVTLRLLDAEVEQKPDFSMTPMLPFGTYRLNALFILLALLLLLFSHRTW